MTGSAGAVATVIIIAAVAATSGTSTTALAREPDRIEMVTMSDGTALSTQLFLPDPGIFGAARPTVLLRTPYPDILGQVDPAITDQIFSYLVDMFGLVLVIQDTRGTGASEGDPDAFFSDWKDGPETVEWVAGQDWCDGQILQFGLSALAIPGYLAAPNAPDQLKCQFLGEAAPDMYRLAAFSGGVLMEDTVRSWLGWVGASSMMSVLEQHRDCDSYWDTLMLDRVEGDVHAAAMHVGGWYDVFTDGIIEGFAAYSSRGDEWARKHQYLVMGPWNHWELAQSLGGGDLEGYSMQGDLLSWVSFCAAGDTSVISQWPRVRYFLMGSGEPGAPGNEWVGSDRWPVPYEDAVYSMESGGLLSPEGEGADDGMSKESDSGLSEPAYLSFSHSDVSPTVGGHNLDWNHSGRKELSKVLSRTDYVMFESDPLVEPLEVVGKLRVDVDVSTMYGDADVIVRLADVYPDGQTWIVSDGGVRLSRRQGCSASIEVEPAERYVVTVDLQSTAMVFNSGHRIAVVLTTTNRPAFELNPVLAAESKANGPLDQAVAVYGGRLYLPVPTHEVEIPDTVETVAADDVEDIVEAVELHDASVSDVITGDAVADASDSGADLPRSDTVVGPDDDVEPADVADSGFDHSQQPDSRDTVSSDVRPGETVDTASTDDGGSNSGGADSGCSASGSAGSPSLYVLFAAMAAVLVLRRRARTIRS